MSINSYVIHYDGLLKKDCFRIVPAGSAEEAEATFNSKFKAKRRITKIELFTSYADIPQVRFKRQMQDRLLAQRSQSIISEDRILKQKNSVWPNGLIPKTHVDYMIAVLANALKLPDPPKGRAK